MLRKQLLYTLIFTYIVIATIGIGLYTTLNKIAISSIQEETNKNYEIMILGLVDNINYIIEDMRKMAIDIKKDNNIKELLFQEVNGQKQRNYYKFVLATRELSEMNSYNSFISDKYIYYQNHDMVLSSKGTCSTDTGYVFFHGGDQKYYNEWLKILNQKHYGGEIINLGGQIIYVESLYIYAQESYANIVILFNKERVQTMMSRSPMAKHGKIYVLDEANNILFSNSDISNSDILEEQAYAFYRTQDNKHTVFKNVNRNLKYIGIIPNEFYSQKVKYINDIFMGFTILFAGSLSIGIWIIYKKYESMMGIFKKMNFASLMINKEQRYDEIDYIEKAIGHMKAEIDVGNRSVVENIFRKSLYGVMHNEEEIQKYLGKRFEMNTFIMAGLVLREETGNKGISKLNEFIIQNVFEETLGKNYELYVISYYKGYVLIVNFLISDQEYMYEEAVHRLGVARTFVEDKINMMYTLTLSDRHTGIQELSKAYNEVQEALEYGIFFNDNKIISYNATIREENSYAYSAQDSIELIKHIKNGDADQSVALVDKLFERLFKNKDISLKNTKRFIDDIGNTLEQVSYDLGISNGDKISDKLGINKIEDIKIIIKNIILKFCEEVKVDKSKKIDERVEKIIEYIQENYCDSNLTVGAIADKFDMKVAYLSRFFKENMNENLLHYITKCRIEKAKELLSNTTYNLNDIAQEVGLLNNVALIRCFKKYEYMTPNEYRDTCKLSL